MHIFKVLNFEVGEGVLIFMGEVEFPSSVSFEGSVYDVVVDRGSDGVIDYFQLQDAVGEFFFECDWVGGFSEEDVLETLADAGVRSVVSDDGGSTSVDSSDRVGRIPVADDVRYGRLASGGWGLVRISGEPVTVADERELVAGFDVEFPYYSDVPDSVKIEAMVDFHSAAGESLKYRRILVSEVIEGWFDEEDD